MDLGIAQTLHTTLLGLIHTGDIKSAHDCSDGGLAVALAESCISQMVARETPRLIGATVDLSGVTNVRTDALLFGETQSRVVISVAAANAVKVVARAKLLGVPAVLIGVVGGADLKIKLSSGELTWALPELHDRWWNSIANAMQ